MLRSRLFRPCDVYLDYVEYRRRKSSIHSGSLLLQNPFKSPCLPIELDLPSSERKLHIGCQSPYGLSPIYILTLACCDRNSRVPYRIALAPRPATEIDPGVHTPGILMLYVRSHACTIGKDFEVLYPSGLFERKLQVELHVEQKEQPDDRFYWGATLS